MARIFYGVVSALTIRTGFCYTTNEKFCKLLNTSERSINAWIKSLEAEGYITVKNTLGTGRRIYISEFKYLVEKSEKLIEKEGFDPRRMAYSPPQKNTGVTPAENCGDLLYYNNKEKNVETPEVDKSSEAYKLSVFLFEETRKKDPKFLINEATRMRTLTTWSKDLEKLIRLDGRTPGEIKNIIQWVKGHSFWAANIMSGKKLREKFSQLVLQAGGTTPPVNPAAPPAPKCRVFKCPVCGKVRPQGHTYTFCKNPECGAPDFVEVKE